MPIIPTEVVPVEGEGTVTLDEDGEPAAPIEEWLMALQQAQTAKSLQAVWKGCTSPVLWPTWSPDEQARLIGAKNEAEKRLGIG